MNKTIKRITAAIAATAVLTVGLTVSASAKTITCPNCGRDTIYDRSVSAFGKTISAYTQLMNSNDMVSAAVSGYYHNSKGEMRNTGWGNQSNHYVRVEATRPSDSICWVNVVSTHQTPCVGQQNLYWAK